MSEIASANNMAVPDAELVARARTGDVPAFEALYRRYNDRIYNFTRQIVMSADDAQDATQEAFLRAWNALPRLRSDETFGVWLHRIALNTSRDVRKKRIREAGQSLDSGPVCVDEEGVTLQIASEDADPEAELLSTEERRAVQSAICTLSEDHRLVVTMHHLEGMDVAAIAEVLGISRGTVMSRLARAREALRRKLTPYIEGERR